MKLLTQELRAKLPPLYSQQRVRDPILQCKFFCPWGGQSWYPIEFDGEDLFFGWTDGPGVDAELGYSSLSEMEAVRGPGGLKIERDKFWEPKSLSEVRKGYQ